MPEHRSPSRSEFHAVCPWPGLSDRGRLPGLAVVAAALAAMVGLLGWAGREDAALAGPDQRLVTDLNAGIRDASALIQALKVITLIGDPVTLYIVVGLGIGVLWQRGRTRPCLFVAVTAFTAGAMNSLLKVLIDRPRPVVDDPLTSAFGQSFPSGHALGATVTYGAILVAVWPLLTPTARRWWSTAVVAVLVAAVGASRVLLGVHYLSDVLAGHLLALAWLSGALVVSARLRPQDPGEQLGAADGST